MSLANGARRLPPPERAFIGLTAYVEADADWFAGRETEITQLANLVQEYPFALFSGHSGAGKTSLLRAGLIPRLHSADWHCVYISFHHQSDQDPVQQQRRLLDDLVGESSPPGATFESAFDRLEQLYAKNHILVTFDQFERLVHHNPTAAKSLYRALEKAMRNQWPRLRVLIAYRGDTDPDVSPPLQRIFGTASGPPRFYLGPCPPDIARQLLHTGFQATGLAPPDDALVATIVDEMSAASDLLPFQLQLIGQTLFQAAIDRGSQIDAVLYEQLGGVQNILNQYLARQLERFDVRRPEAEKILVSLTRQGQQSERQLQDTTGLKAELGDRDWSQLLADLSAAHLIHTDQDRQGATRIEIAHELLAEMVERETVMQERELRRLRGTLALRAAALEHGPVVMRSDAMAELYLWRARIVPSPTELRLLLHNGLMAHGPTWYWLRRIPRAGLRPFLIQAYESLLPELHRAGGLALAAAATLTDFVILQTLLADDDETVQKAAARAIIELISQMGWDEALMLRHLLDTPDIDVRHAAAESLSDVLTQAHRVGPVDQAERDIIRDLPELLRDDDPDIRFIGDRTLSQIAVWQDIPFLRQLLQDPNLDVLNAAWNALHRVLEHTPPEKLDELRAMLHDDDPYVQGAARQALTQIIAQMGTDHLALLRELSEDNDPNVRSAATLSLVQVLAERGADAIPDLRPFLDDWDAEVRRAAGLALAEALSARGDVALPELHQMMDNPDRPVRLAFVQVLTQLLTRQGRDAIPELRELLKDPDPEVCQLARSALEEVLAQVGRDVIPDLQAMLDDPNWDVWQAAGLALARVLAELGRPGLRDLRVLLKEGEDPEVRRAGGEALAAVLRDLGRVSLPELHKMLDDQDAAVQRAAGCAMAQMLGQTGARGIPDLRRLLQHPDPEITVAAGEALCDMAVRLEQDALPVLRDMLTAEHPPVAAAAQTALERVTESLGQRTIPYLREMLQDRQPAARHAAAAAIAAQDPTQGLQAWAELAVAYPLDNQIAIDALVALDRQLYCPFADTWGSRVENLEPSATTPAAGS